MSADKTSRWNEGPSGVADASRARLKALADATFEAVFFSMNGVCIDANERAETVLGRPRDRMIGHPMSDLVIPEHRDLVKQNIAKGWEEPYEVRGLRGDGSTFPCEIRGRMFDEGGRRVRVTSVRDLSSRRAAEAALRLSERRNRAMVDAIPDLLFVVDRDCRFIDYKCPEDHGLLVEPESFLDRVPEAVLPAGIAADTRRAALLVFETGATQSLEYSIPTPDGPRVYESRASAYGVDSVLFIVREVTETKRLREAENRSQRLETAGRIAGQVAHDFNNLLAPLTGYPALILDTLSDGHPAIEMVESMAAAAREMAEINQQLLTLGRRGHYNQSPLDLNEVVRQVVRRLPPRPESIRIETDLEDELLRVDGGQAQLARAVTNLVHNALDAVDVSGTVRIVTRNRYMDEATTRYGYIPIGEYVLLRIEDDGCGIPEDSIDRICEPFYTTKTVGLRRGSGLGLSVVAGVVKDHGGHLDLTTTPGRGTVFDVYLPVTRVETASSVETAPQHDGGCVLVADDDPIQREVASRLLERLGYTVRTVDSGEAAVATLRRFPVDLVVLDMVMPPGIDGAETLRRILEVRPGQRAILVSGYSETERVRAARELGAHAFVRKPVTPESLGAAVAAALAERVDDREAGS